MRRTVIGTALAFGLVAGGAAHAAPYEWADWTSADATSASGTIGGTSISFSGNLNPAAQTAGGINYWAVNPAIYTGGNVDNGPPDSDIIRITGGSSTGTQTITFGAPVVDPVLAILSLGQPSVGVRYIFDAPFTVVNQGAGFWGGGSLVNLTPTILQGFEGHGLIQFAGTFTSISFTAPDFENWHGFQVGILGTPVSEPALIGLLGLGLAGIGLAARRRHG